MTELLNSKYMLTNENIRNFLPNDKVFSVENKKHEKRDKNEKNDKNILKIQMLLFWTIYKIVNGDFFI